MKYPFLLLTLTAVGLSGCTGLTGPVIMGADAAGIYETRPDKLPPADTAAQIPEHQSWCYATMGDTQCFAHPQNVPPERLVNVEPQSAYPIDLPSYKQSLIGKPAVSPTPVVDLHVEKAKLKEEVNSEAATPVLPPPVETQATP